MQSKKESKPDKPLSFIFSLDVKEAETYIKKQNIPGCWFLRESSKPGCLTITYLKYSTGKVEHNRLGFVDGKWQIVHGKKYAESKTRIAQSKMNCEKSVRQLISYLKEIGPRLNGKMGFNIHSDVFFKPSVSRESACGYSAYDSSYLLTVDDSKESKEEKPAGTIYVGFFSSDESEEVKSLDTRNSMFLSIGDESSDEDLPEIESPFTARW